MPQLMNKTDGYVYLAIDDPVTAWAAVRGVLVSRRVTSPEAGFVSRWFAGLIQAGNEAKLQNELAIEAIRAQRYSSQVSRLSGIYVFEDIEAARKAEEWGVFFTAKNLAELSLLGVEARTRVDANWISAHLRDTRVLQDHELGWVDHYWGGRPYPAKQPVWESIVEGRAFILGTELRNRALERVRSEFPESMAIVEVSRAAAWIGSDYGNISGFLFDRGDAYEFTYLLNGVDTNDPEFRRRLIEEKAIVNPEWLRPDQDGNFGKRPDLRSYGFRVPKFPQG